MEQPGVDRLDLTYDPVLVVGTGRCGTSTVARILHTRFGVCMGPDGIEIPLENNPQGGYEDAEIIDTNRALLKGYIDLTKWAATIEKAIQARSYQPWGFKDPHMARIIGLYLPMFANPMVIWCRRAKDLVIKSILKCWGGAETESRAAAHYDITETVLNRILRNRPHLVIDFADIQLSEKYIERELEVFLNAAPL